MDKQPLSFGRRVSVVSAAALAVVSAGVVIPRVNHAATRSLTAITVTPANPMVSAGQTQTFTATGTFSDGTTQVLNVGGGGWTATGSLAMPRFYHTATLLQDGSVLVAGGYNNTTTFASAERYYPASGTWVSAGSMSTPRLSHSATLLPNGKVIVVGGISFPGNTLYNTTEIFDPTSNSWSPGPPLTLGVRASHPAVLLPNGKVLVVAGLQSYPDCTYRMSAELYDPASGPIGAWTATGSLSLNRSGATIALLANGKVLLAGGPQNNCPTPNVGLSEAEIYDPGAGTWSVTGNLSISRYSNAISLLASGKVLLAGGYSSGGPTATADLYDAGTGTFSLTGSLPEGRVVTGGTGDNGTTPVLQNGQVLVVGGADAVGNVFATGRLYDPGTGAWTATGSLTTPRTYHTTTLLQDGRVLVAGGAGTGGVTLSSAELYAPQDIGWSSSNSGVASIGQTGTATGLLNGTTTISATAGAVIGSTTLTVADTTAPTSSSMASPAANATGWNKTDVTVTLSATDNAGGSGVQAITYALAGAQTGGGTFPGSSTGVTISNQGTTTVTYHAIDNAGNTETSQTVTVKIDKTPPTLSPLPNITVNATSAAGALVTFNPVASDALSGLDTVAVTQGLASGATFPHGTTSEQVTATDKAGNTTIQSFTVTVNRTLTSIAVSPSTAAITLNQPSQQFTATGTYTDASTQNLSGGGGTWTAGGSLATARLYHTATLLQDGSVLVAGGYNGSVTFASAERYYPATGTWVSVGSMASARLGHTATLLQSGKVIVVGGISYPSHTLYDTTEIFDPASNTWSAGPSLTLGGRDSHSAVLLPNGKVLIVAGLQTYPDCTYRASAELYDPLANTWTQTGSLSLARSGATTIRLANGTVLLAGGPENNCPSPNNGVSEAEVYDPASGTWSITGNLSIPRYANTISLLSNGKVLLAGGNTVGSTFTTTADLYDPTTGTFALTESMATARANSYGFGDVNYNVVLQNGQVLVVGGTNSSGTTWASAELYDPASATWATTGSLATARAFTTATVLVDGRVLVVGGAGGNGAALASAELYNPSPVFWSTSAGNVATISQTGIATGVANGTATITASAGNISGTATLTVDKTPPTTTATPSPAPNANGWNKTDVNVMLHATDNPGGAVQSIEYSLFGAQNGGPFTVAGDTANFTISVEGQTTVNYRATDANGNVESNKTVFVRVDKTPPTINYPQSGVPANATSPAGAVVTFSVSAFDTTSGLVGQATVAPLASGATFPVGTTTETVTATDAAGNVATEQFNVVVNPYDSTPPTTNANVQPPNANGWYRFNVFVGLSAFDSGGQAFPSGVQSITYSLSGAQTGGGTFNTSFTPIQIVNEGTTTVTYHATDNNGNVEQPDHILTIKLDKTAPSVANLPNLTVQATSSAGAVVFFDPTPSDALSGIDTVTVLPLASGSTFPHGTTSETVTVTDKAGNTTSRFFSVTVNKTLLSIAVSPSTATISTGGGGRQFTATGHFTSGSDQVLPTSGGGGGGGGGGPIGGSSWQIQFPLPNALNISACSAGSAGFTSQGFSPRVGTVHTSWGNPAVVQVDGSVTPQDVHLTLSCIPANGATGSIDASWTGTRYVGTWSFSGSSGNATITGWSTKAPLSAPRFSLGAAAVDGIVYVMGAGNPGLPIPVEAYNPATDSWSTVSQMPVSSEGPGVAALNGRVYVAGGHVAGGNSSGVFQAYDPAANVWSALASMPTARAHLALVAAGGKLYAIGGETGAGSGPPTNVVERYDPATNQWTTQASMATARSFHVAGALNNDTMIVAAGGSGTSTELYDVSSNTWTSGPTMLSSGGAPAAAVVNNAMFVFGIGGTGVNMFRPAGSGPAGWAGLAAMPTGRGELGAAAVGDVVYAIGGLLSGGSTATSVVEAYSTPPPGDLFVTSGSGGGGGSSLPTVSWQSTNQSAAGINSSGFAFANGVGQTTIVAAAAGVSCTATNTCGTLTVVDMTPPNLNLPNSQTREATSAAGAVVTYFASAFDSVDGPRPVTCNPPSGSTFPLGPTTVNCSASDTSGNVAHGSFTITVADTTAPFLSVPDNVTQEAASAAGAVVTYTASASDLVDGPVPVTCVPASGSTFALGQTTVNCSATDAHNNTRQGRFAVTVQDTTRPSLTLPPNITVDATSPSGAVVTFAASASDLVSGTVAVSCVPPSGSTFPIGTSTVNCSATDGAGNTANGSVQVLVQAAAAQVSNLIVAVQNFNLAQGISNSLDAKLQNILSALNAAQGGNVTTTCSQLGAFINETQAQSGKQLTVDQANQLIAAATRIKAVIGCP